MKKYLSLLMAVILIAALLGCHVGGNSPMAPDNSAVTVTPYTRTVGANGRFTDITFPSGAVIKCPNDSTFQEGVKVTAAEQKVPVITDNSGKFSYIYVYNISAVLPSENSLTADVPVNTIEKPISVTLPNDSTAGTCYIGTRASESDPWRYSLASDGINSNARFMRLASNPPKTCTFNLYRLNIMFRLFVFDNESKKDEVQVDTIAVKPAEDVEIKDNKYTGKLTVKVNIEGENLNGLKADDLIARITYRSANEQGANIDFTTNKTDSSDKAVTGSYEHSFEISNIKVENTLGNTAELSFELNLDGVSLEDFPTDFLVEFYSKGSDENTRPFEYTQAISFETKEEQDNPDNPDNPDPQPQPDPEPEPEPEPEPGYYTLALNCGTGIASVEGKGNYKADESITLNCTVKDGYEFVNWTDSEGNTVTSPFTMPEKAVTLTANAKVITYKIAYNLDNGQLTTDNPSDYTVENDDITLTNPTKNGYTFTGWSGTGLTGNNNTTVTIAKGSTGAREYTANFTPTNFTITYTNIDGAKFATANPTSYYIESDAITLTNPTKTGYEFLGWTYEGQNTPTTSVTIPHGSTGAKEYTAHFNLLLTLKIASDTGAVFEPVADNLYKLSPTFTITPTLADGVVMTDTEKANILSALSVKDSGDKAVSSVSKSWSNGNIALSFSKDLTASTTFTISFGEIDDVTLTCAPLSFKTFYLKGSGTNGDPYLIENAAQLDLVRNYLDKYFEQAADIDLDGINWLPIGDNTNKFTGNYNGNNKTISNLSISFESTNVEKYNNGYVGLFGYNSGSISNLTIDSASININSNLYHYIGCLLGKNYGGTIENCKVTKSTISGSSSDSSFDVGGICGDSGNSGTITDCNVEDSTINVAIAVNGDVLGYAGGICGVSDGTITDCWVEDTTLNCSANGETVWAEIGGICGCISNNVTFTGNNVKNTNISCSGTGSVNCYVYVGGILGELNEATMTNCSVVNDFGIHEISGSINMGESGIGGICGLSMIGNITSSYVKGYNIECTGDGAKKVGGICGYMQGGQTNSCYFYEGSITCTSGNFGYLVGDNGGGGTVKDCFTSRSDTISLVGNGTAATTSYEGISTLSDFTTDNGNPRAWSDGLAYNNANSVWKDFDFGNWPPKLDWEQ